jgi:hypothetical protein
MFSLGDSIVTAETAQAASQCKLTQAQAFSTASHPPDHDEPR